MLAQLTRWGQAGTRRLTRTYWTQKLLRLPSTPPGGGSGLVMIQIDGLSRGELETALATGRMPFLRHLRRHEGYRLEDVYSGVPSTTPAVQAELFYGVRQAVPAFSYVERATGQRRRFYEAGAARAKEAELARRGTPLLTGGSAYGNIYTGGAEEAHFCIADMGWDQVVRRAGAGRLLVLALTHIYSFARMLAVGLIEFGHAVLEADPLTRSRHAIKELKFIPTRVGINAMLREFQVMGARVDIARGRPIIHLNFLGYDENAHRRGPGTWFARRPLRGIDDAIARIWRAAARAPTRNYQVWIYSDHGQERVASFAADRGESFEAAVTQLVAELAPAGTGAAPGAGVPLGPVPQPVGAQLTNPYSAGAGEQSQRIGQLGAPRVVDRLPRQPHPDRWPGSPAVSVTAMGPLGHIYLGAAATATLKRDLADALVQRLGVPLVILARQDGAGTAVAVTRAGAFDLPREASAVLGSSHGYGAETAAELAELSHHSDSGDLVVSGWRPGGSPLTFPVESGAHGGPGSAETAAFCLLPAEAPAPARTSRLGGAYHRALDLRAAAFRLLGRVPAAEDIAQAPAPVWHRPSAPQHLRVVTYNVHSCRGLDGRVSPQRIASVLAQLDPDIVALQELDVGRVRSGGIDQAAAIAEALNMEARFHPAFTVQEEAYGDAILTHLPVTAVATTRLPRPPRDTGRAETRGALAVTVTTGAGPLRVVTTHLGLRGAERRDQVAALMESALIRPGDGASPVATILLGDFNAGLGRRELAPLYRQFRDAVTARQTGDGRRRTFFAGLPALSLDHIFVDAGTVVHWARPWRSSLARRASDHLPLVADIGLPDPRD